MKTETALTTPCRMAPPGAREAPRAVPHSNIVQVDHEGWITDFAVDSNDRRSSVMAGGFPVADYLFAGPGLRTAQVSMFNGSLMSAGFDGFAREITRDWTNGGLLISSFTNTYNNRHERLSETWNHYGGFFTDVTLDSASRTTASRFKTDPNTMKGAKTRPVPRGTPSPSRR